MPPFFSVVIPNWNGKHHLDECLTSLRGQTFKSFETVLVDNGSSDGSVEYVRSNFPEVKLCILPENIGFAGGVNAGIKASAGSYVVLLNNDTEVVEQWLEHLAAAITAHPDLFIFASNLVNYFERDLVDSAGDGMDLSLGPYKIGERLPVQGFKGTRFIFGACGGGGCYKRELFEEIGLFDEDFFAYFEDVDLSFRANWAGHRCLSVPDAVIYHKVGGTSDTNQARRDRFDIMRRRNFFYLILKNYPISFLLKFFPFIFVSHCLLFVVNLFRGRFKVALMTQWDIVKGLPKVLVKRQSIMSSRRISNAQMHALCLPKYGSWGGFLRKKFASVFGP
jgi:GT2 family glycosyltransferase